MRSKAEWARGPEYDGRVQLARMEGKLDLINERLLVVNGDLADVHQSLVGQDTRIRRLEDDIQQRKGALVAVKAMWAAGGFTLLGSVALVAKYLS